MQVDGSKKVYQVCHNGAKNDKGKTVSYDPNEAYLFSCTYIAVITHGYLCRHIEHVITQNQ